MRINKKGLECNIKTINCLLNTSDQPYTKHPEGVRANVGNYHLSMAYGGYALHHMVNESGGAADVFNKGHMTARELSNLLHGFIAGIYLIQSRGLYGSPN
jgi:hypothetical protein